MTHFHSVFLGVLFRDLVYLNDSLPTFVGSQKLINVLKVFQTYISLLFSSIVQFRQMASAVVKWHMKICERKVDCETNEIYRTFVLDLLLLFSSALKILILLFHEGIFRRFINVR